MPAWASVGEYAAPHAHHEPTCSTTLSHACLSRWVALLRFTPDQLYYRLSAGIGQCYNYLFSYTACCTPSSSSSLTHPSLSYPSILPCFLHPSLLPSLPPSLTPNNRNPDPQKRPNFSFICDFLQASEDSLLLLPDPSPSLSPYALQLGASLGEAKNLYINFQYCYDESHIYTDAIEPV